jgi:hypothetical protein
LLVDTPADGRSIALQSEIRKMGMKTISFPGKDLFLKPTPWLSVISHWRFAEGAAAGAAVNRLLRIGWGEGGRRPDEVNTNNSQLP